MRFSVSARTVVRIGSALAFLGVALGAFGAHALEETLEQSGHTGTWKTAVFYHLIHSVAVVAIGFAYGARGGGAVQVPLLSWGFFTDGVVFFSGSLYWLSLGGPRWLGPVTPIGGLLFLIGWLWIAWAPFRPAGSGPAPPPPDGGRVP